MSPKPVLYRPDGSGRDSYLQGYHFIPTFEYTPSVVNLTCGHPVPSHVGGLRQASQGKRPSLSPQPSQRLSRSKQRYTSSRLSMPKGWFSNSVIREPAEEEMRKEASLRIEEKVVDRRFHTRLKSSLARTDSLVTRVNPNIFGRNEPKRSMRARYPDSMFTTRSYNVRKKSWL